jgi:hypothetical protein
MDKRPAATEITNGLTTKLTNPRLGAGGLRPHPKSARSLGIRYELFDILEPLSQMKH